MERDEDSRSAKGGTELRYVPEINSDQARLAKKALTNISICGRKINFAGMRGRDNELTVCLTTTQGLASLYPSRVQSAVQVR